MKKPHVTINCAMTADGKLALADGTQIRISSEEDMKRVYNLRNSVDAIIIGIGTVLSDNPKLTVKEKYVKNPKNPLRIVLDSKCRTPENALVVNDKAKTLIVTTKNICDKKFGENVEILKLSKDNQGLIDLKLLLKTLYNRGINNLLVEGGGSVIWSIIKNNLFDEIYVFIGPLIVGGKKTPSMTHGKGFKNSDKVIKLDLVDFKKIGDGILIHYKPKEG